MNLLGSQKTKPGDVEIPVGSFIHTESGYFYVHSPGKRKKFSTPRVLASWEPKRVLEVSEKQPNVAALRLAGKMLFREGSLLYQTAQGSIYLVSGFKLRLIRNPDYFTLLGAKTSNAIWVSESELNLHENGEPLD